MEINRKKSLDGLFFEIHEEADYRFIVTDMGDGELALGLHPAGLYNAGDGFFEPVNPGRDIDDIKALGRPGLSLVYCLRPGTTDEEAGALCYQLNKVVVRTRAVLSIPLPQDDGSGDPPLEPTVAPEAA